MERRLEELNYIGLVGIVRAVDDGAEIGSPQSCTLMSAGARLAYPEFRVPDVENPVRIAALERAHALTHGQLAQDLPVSSKMVFDVVAALSEEPSEMDGMGASVPEPIVLQHFAPVEIYEARCFLMNLVGSQRIALIGEQSKVDSRLPSSTHYAERNKSLAGVADFLSNPEKTLVEPLEYIMKVQHLGNGEPHPVVVAAAREMLNKAENERSGVFSTAMSHLSLYRDPVAANTEDSDFRIADLVNAP